MEWDYRPSLEVRGETGICVCVCVCTRAHTHQAFLSLRAVSGEGSRGPGGLSLSSLIMTVWQTGRQEVRERERWKEGGMADR